MRHQPPRGRFWESMGAVWRRKTSVIAVFSIAAIILHLILRFGFRTSPGAFQIPLLAVLVFGGIPLVYELLRKLLKREFGSDLLGGISIITSVILGEYLAGSIIVLMLAGGEALENYALKSASSVLGALAKRMPLLAHRKCGSEILDVVLEEIAVGDALVVYPHEICPVDGVVVEGHGVMDESYLTGEPFEMSPEGAEAMWAVNRDQWLVRLDPSIGDLQFDIAMVARAGPVRAGAARHRGRRGAVQARTRDLWRRRTSRHQRRRSDRQRDPRILLGLRRAGARGLRHD